MNTNLDQLLTNVYELEGLLLVMQRHHDDVPQLVIDRFKEKTQQIAAAASVLDSLKKTDETPQEEPVPPAFVPPVQPVQPVQPEPQVVAPEPEVTQVQEPVVEPVVEAKPIVKTEEPVAPQKPATNDITAAFSINDRFLFQRELFDGNKEKYADAIAVMQRMGNIDKIKEFITDVLQFDRSNEVVKEFVRLIEQSFKG
ncbi:MAG: hypothetical protein IK100_01665 [Muribaculaceae bacterium]|nr:hypothetical protein [Muribaculaceae bacterium]